MNNFASALYRIAPVWGQNALLSGYATVLDRQRYGGGFARFQNLLARSEFWSKNELEAYQDDRLRAIVAHAYESVPFYRRRFDAIGLAPADISGRRDLPKIPLLTRNDVRTEYDDLWSRSVPPRERYTGHTSGTTGTPLTIGYDRETIWLTYAVFDRHYRWAGLTMGWNKDRVAVARGNVIVPLSQRTAPFWRFNWRQNQMLLSSFHMSKTNMPAYLAAMRGFNPTVLDGYPSTLYLIAKYLQNCGETLPLRAAITSSETLYGFQRELIEERFACRVHDYYALAERAIFSGECDRHQGHHVAMEYGIAEIVDESGMLCEAGSLGRLVGTTLHNRAMPLLRYVTNDCSALRPHLCGCGRQLELVDDVTTKAEDLLTLKDGRLISPSVLTHPFKPLHCIEGSQIVQSAPDAITIKLIPGSGYTDAVQQHLIKEFKARLGEDVEIKIEEVAALERSRNGKFKWVISRVPLGL